jgi:hypothetical protein
MILEIIEAARTAAGALDRSREVRQELSRLVQKDLVAKDVLPDSLPTSLHIALNRLDKCLASAESQLSRIREMWEKTLENLIQGKKLERGEFYLFMSAEIFAFPEDDWEKFQMLLYEDDQVRGYINPQRVPSHSGVLRIGNFGIQPENVRISFLSPAQQEFFKDHAPDVWLRFDHRN